MYNREGVSKILGKWEQKVEIGTITCSRKCLIEIRVVYRSPFIQKCFLRSIAGPFILLYLRQSKHF